jgi:cell division septation protein DedD
VSSPRLPPDAPEAVRKQRKRVLWLVALVAVAAAAAAARFIASLSDPFAGVQLQTTKTRVSATTRAPAARAAAPAQKPATPPPASEPPQPAPQVISPQVSSQVEFLVQLGAFRNETHARKLAARATRAGFPSSVDKGTTADGETIYRVRLRQALLEEPARQLVIQLKQEIPGLQPSLERP